MSARSLTPLSAVETLNREFLGIRARLIDLAATLDRVYRGAGCVADDPRMSQIRRSLQVLAGEGNDRAAQVQQIFSLPYREGWQQEYGLDQASPRATIAPANMNC